jgi:hypothetical protein
VITQIGHRDHSRRVVFARNTGRKVVRRPYHDQTTGLLSDWTAAYRTFEWNSYSPVTLGLAPKNPIRSDRTDVADPSESIPLPYHPPVTDQTSRIRTNAVKSLILFACYAQ